MTPTTPVLNALDLCNCCEIEPAIATSPGGYCAECEAEARAFSGEHETETDATCPAERLA